MFIPLLIMVILKTKQHKAIIRFQDWDLDLDYYLNLAFFFFGFGWIWKAKFKIKNYSSDHRQVRSTWQSQAASTWFVDVQESKILSVRHQSAMVQVVITGAFHVPNRGSSRGGRPFAFCSFYYFLLVHFSLIHAILQELFILCSRVFDKHEASDSISAICYALVWVLRGHFRHSSLVFRCSHVAKSLLRCNTCGPVLLVNHLESLLCS